MICQEHKNTAAKAVVCPYCHQNTMRFAIVMLCQGLRSAINKLVARGAQPEETKELEDLLAMYEGKL